MANERVGEMVCPICEQIDEVRINSKKKLYWYCEEYGIVQPAKPKFQGWIRPRTRFDNDGADNAEQVPPGRTSDKPEPAKEWQPEEAKQQKAAAAATPEREAPKKRPGGAFVKAMINILGEEG